ncbi:MAG: ABC transporter substrate-binding protein [Gemmatimonas sp.]
MFSGLRVARHVLARYAHSRFARHFQACLLTGGWLLVAGACAPREATPNDSTVAATQAVGVTDDAGNIVRLAHPATRIISLIPSATETLIAIGAAPQIVGRTRYDVAPEVMNLPSVGGGVDASVEAIAALKPDLVVGWESDKRQLIRPKLQALNIPMFLLRTQDTTDVFRGMGKLGHLTGKDLVAARVLASLRADLDSVKQSVAGLPSPKVFYVVFNDPPMTAGPKTFIGQLITIAGGVSVFSDTATGANEKRNNWPNVAMEEIVRRDPDLIIVPVGEFKGNSIERFQKMQGWRTLRAVREGNVRAVPADLLSRPSPNIGKAAHALRHAFYPQFPLDSALMVPPQ